MKVAYVTPYYNGEIDGRFGRFHDWVHALRDSEDPPFDFDILALTASNEDETLSSSPHSFLGDATNLWGKKRNKLEFVLNAPRLLRDLNQSKYDVVHVLTLDLIAYPLSALNGTKLVVGPDIQGYFPQRQGHQWEKTGVGAWKNTIDYKIKRILIKTVKQGKIVALSQYHKDLISSLSVSEEQVEVIPPGVNPIFRPSESINDCNQPTEFLYVGDLSEYKGYNIFIRALSSLPEDIQWEATIIGTGDPEQERLRELGIQSQVNLEGFVERGNLPKYYQEADLFVMPSIDENGPNTIVESLACGTPVIVTDKPGINEYTPEGAGLHFDRTIEDLTEKLIMACENINILTKNAMASASSYQIYRTITSLNEIYKKISK